MKRTSIDIASIIKEEFIKEKGLRFGGGREEEKLLQSLTPQQKLSYKNIILAYQSQTSFNYYNLIVYTLNFVSAIFGKENDGLIRFD